MSSTNKTSLGLNMWEASDKPVRQDFVNDNVIIDEKITKLNSDFNYFSQQIIHIGNDKNIIVQCVRRGLIVDITFIGNKPISFFGTPFVLFSLREEFRPSNIKYINVYGLNMLIQILPNGDVITYQEAVNATIYGQCAYSV